MKILGIETSSSVFSLCLNDDEQVLHEFKRQREFEGHRDGGIFNEAKRLMDSLGDNRLDAIAISIGPGMFTSLRVGLSLAKGIAMSNGTPVVAVNTLDAIGVEPSKHFSPLVAVINAYRGEIYAAFYDNGNRKSEYLLMTPADLVRSINVRTTVIGPGVHLLKETDLDGKGFEIRMDEEYLPSASKVICVGLPRIRQCAFDDIEFLEPYYIKRTDAERRYDKSDAV